MKLLKNTKFAAAVAAMICIASMFAGTNKSLAALSKSVEDRFYSGTQAAEGYTLPSIASQLSFCMDQAAGLITIANNHTELGDASSRLGTLRNMLYVELNDTRDISAVPEIFPAFTDAFDNLYKTMDEVELTDRDRGLAAAYEKDFRSAHIFITQLAESYNAEVAKYSKAASTFPANLFGFFTDSPAKF